MSATSLEREIKLRFDSAEDAREAVLAAGCTPLLGRRLQEDALLDTEDEQLRRRRCVLRVRVENGKSRITFKGPVQPSMMKLREEVETVVGDGEVLLRIFEELGLHVWFRYEKYREEFSARRRDRRDRRDAGRGLRRDRRRRAGHRERWRRRSDATPADYILDSYRGLFLQHREALRADGVRHGVRHRGGARCGPRPSD